MYANATAVQQSPEFLCRITWGSSRVVIGSIPPSVPSVTEKNIYFYPSNGTTLGKLPFAVYIGTKTFTKGITT
jgi:hypothetical protein